MWYNADVYLADFKKRSAFKGSHQITIGITEN